MIPKTNALPSFNADEKGVSPVIGVILMVAITVILAAVIGSFVLGIGGNVSQTPQASFEFNPNADTIIHQGGDTFKAGTLNITGGATGSGPYNVTAKISAGDDLTDHLKNASGSSVNDYSFNESSTVRVIYSAPGSDKTSVIATYNA